MARLPAPEDLPRLRAPADTPNVRIKTPDYGPMAAAGQAIARGGNALAGALFDLSLQGDKEQEYETAKRLLDFRLDSEMALEEHKRTMPPGGGDYAESWGKEYQRRAREFVGKDDANIPQASRGKIGLALKQQQVMLQERAIRDQNAEADRAELEGLNATLGKTLSFVEADPSRREEMSEEGRRLIELARLPPAAKFQAIQKWATSVDKTAVLARLMKAQTVEEWEALKKDLAPNAPDRRSDAGGKPTKASGWAESAGDLVIKPVEGYTAPARGSRRAGIEGVVIHHTAGSTLAGALEHGSKVGTGATFYVDRDGSVVQWVPETERMVHIMDPGSKSRKAGAFDSLSNDSTIGIEVVARNDADVTPQQKGALDKLLRTLVDRHKIDPEKVIGHGEIQGGHPFGNREVNEGSYAREFRGSFTRTAGPAGQELEAEAYSGPYSRLTLQERRTLWNQAETQRAKQIDGLDKELRAVEQNVSSNGNFLPDGMMESLKARVEATGDQGLATRYAATFGLAAETRRLQQMPPPLLEQYTQNLRQRAADSGVTDAGEKYIKHAEKVAETVARSVKDDPLTWAMRTRAPMVPVPNPAGTDVFLEPVTLKSLDFNPKTVDATLAERMEQAKAVGAYYAQPVQVFTKQDRSTLQAVLRQGGPLMLYTMGKIATAAVNAGLPPEQVMKEFGGGNAPELGIIGELVANNGDRTTLDTAAAALAYKASMKENYKSYVDHAQAKANEGDYAKILGMQRGKVDAVRALADLVYTYEAPRKGIQPNDFKGDLYQDIVGRLMGKVSTPDGLSYGGIGQQGTGWMDGKWATKVMVPPGVRTDMFDDFVGAIRDGDLAKLGETQPVWAGDSKPFTAAEIRRATWVNTGELGRYLLQTGQRSDGTPVYAVTGRTTSDGRPELYVLDARQLMEPLRRRKPEMFLGYDGLAKGVSDETMVIP